MSAFLVIPNRTGSIITGAPQVVGDTITHYSNPNNLQLSALRGPIIRTTLASGGTQNLGSTTMGYYGTYFPVLATALSARKLFNLSILDSVGTTLFDIAVPLQDQSSCNLELWHTILKNNALPGMQIRNNDSFDITLEFLRIESGDFIKYESFGKSGSPNNIEM
jgi:hypothetical protein